jgi:hypothetical protein
MAKVEDAPRSRGLKACCLVSEMLEEMGLDSHQAREIRRQTLLGLMTFCQWQLSRMDEGAAGQTASEGPTRRPRGRRVKVS